MGSRVGSWQRAQSAWQDGQPIFTAVHQPARLRTVEFPSKKEILLAQQSAVNEYEWYLQGNATAWQEGRPQQVDSGGMRMMNNALWIPEPAVELQLRLCVEAHCRSEGHRVYEATFGAIKEYLVCMTMAKDVKVFVQNCLHCVATIHEDKCHAHWVCSYMQPSPTGSCTLNSCTLGCQETGIMSTCYFSRMT
jgi:hypothetical protein